MIKRVQKSNNKIVPEAIVRRWRTINVLKILLGMFMNVGQSSHQRELVVEYNLPLDVTGAVHSSTALVHRLW